MDLNMPGTVLTKDLLTADGRLVASRGETLDLAFLKKVADSARLVLHERPLHETSAAEAVLEAFESQPLMHLVGNETSRALVADTMADVRFPQPVWDELEALRVPQFARLQVAVEGPRDQDLRDGQPLTPLLTRCVRQKPDPGVGRQGLGESGPAALAGIVRHQDVRPVVRTPHRGHCARS